MWLIETYWDHSRESSKDKVGGNTRVKGKAQGSSDQKIAQMKYGR